MTHSNRVTALQRFRQSVWLDHLRRSLFTSGKFGRLIAEDGLRGVTSNPSIFEKAFSPDDLPISFILRRDSPVTTEKHRRRSNRMSPCVQKADSHSKTHAAPGRPGARNTLRSEGHPVGRAGGDHHPCHHCGSGRSNQQVS
jgi:hypothetical protein